MDGAHQKVNGCGVWGFCNQQRCAQPATGLGPVDRFLSLSSRLHLPPTLSSLLPLPVTPATPHAWLHECAMPTQWDPAIALPLVQLQQWAARHGRMGASCQQVAGYCTIAQVVGAWWQRLLDPFLGNHSHVIPHSLAEWLTSAAHRIPAANTQQTAPGPHRTTEP